MTQRHLSRRKATQAEAEEEAIPPFLKHVISPPGCEKKKNFDPFFPVSPPRPPPLSRERKEKYWAWKMDLGLFSRRVSLTYVSREKTLGARRKATGFDGGSGPPLPLPSVCPAPSNNAHFPRPRLCFPRRNERALLYLHRFAHTYTRVVSA